MPIPNLTRSGTNLSTTFDQQTDYTDIYAPLVILAGCSLSFVIVSGNVLVVFAYFLYKNLRSVTNLLILSLSVTDTIVGCVSINFYTYYVATGHWSLGKTFCNMYLCFDYGCCQASVIHLVIICIDRYNSITNPLKYRVKRTKTRVQLIIFISWCVAFLQWAPWIMSYPYINGKYTVKEDDCYVQFLFESWIVTLITSLAAYYVPIAIMGVIYIRIYLLLKRREKNLLSLMKISHSKCKDSTLRRTKFLPTHLPISGIPMRRNAAYIIPSSLSTDTEINGSKPKILFLAKQKRKARLLSVVFFAFFFTWLPHYVLTLLSPFDPDLIHQALWKFSYMFCYCNSALNPMCYALCNKNFRTAFKRILCRGVKCTR